MGDRAILREDEPETLLPHDPFASILGRVPFLFDGRGEICILGVVGVMLSRFLGVERNCTLAQGATCSSGVDGGVIRGFLRGEATLRNCIASSPLLPEVLVPLLVWLTLELLLRRLFVEYMGWSS